MKIIVLDEVNFVNEIFGGADILKFFPKLRTSGVSVKKIEDEEDNFYLIDDNGKIYDTCFLTTEEIKKESIKIIA